MAAVAVVSILAAVLCVYYFNKSPPALPVFDEEEWWNLGSPKFQDITLRPFKISFYDQLIKDLNSTLDRYLQRNATPPLEAQGFQYGFNSDYLKEVITYWRDDYNFKAREAYLNKYPQFQTFIQGLDIHFIRVTPEATAGKKVLPLLLLHGWPGSVREFYELVPLLTTPRDSADFVFEVIIPSLPGYGFSQGAAKPGLGIPQIAVIMKNLMKRLKIDQFYVQGGDWGSLVARAMAVLYPRQVLGLHSNLCLVMSPKVIALWMLGSLYPPAVVDQQHRALMYPFTDRLLFLLEEMGYAHLQATKPDTVGIALRDSPVGLAAYILEKFSTWVNPKFKNLPDGGLTRKFNLDELLDNVMIYWSSGCITTASRLYAEHMNLKSMTLGIEQYPVEVPTACARFRHDIQWQPEFMLREGYPNLVHVSDHDAGHFSAMEEPYILSEDIWSAVQRFRDVHV